MSRFRLSHLARIDLARIHHYIARDKPGAADRQVARFFRTIHTLAKHPELGQRYPDFGDNLRGLSVGTYVIFYRPMTNGVEVARMVSGFQDLDALFAPSSD